LNHWTPFTFHIQYILIKFLEDAELVANKAMGIQMIKAGSAALGQIPVIGGILAPAFDYAAEVGIKIAEKYCRLIKREGREWKFDSLLDKVEVTCKDYAKAKEVYNYVQKKLEEHSALLSLFHTSTAHRSCNGTTKINLLDMALS